MDAASTNPNKNGTKSAAFFTICFKRIAIPTQGSKEPTVNNVIIAMPSIGNVFLGVILFHLMFIVAPSTGAKITGDSMIGEYFRVFISYGVITLALIMYETKKRKAKGKAGQMLQLAQSEEDGQ